MSPKTARSLKVIEYIVTLNVIPWIVFKQFKMSEIQGGALGFMVVAVTQMLPLCLLAFWVYYSIRGFVGKSVGGYLMGGFALAVASTVLAAVLGYGLLIMGLSFNRPGPGP